jgi:geranylgeranyl pyrophosphate synthase
MEALQTLRAHQRIEDHMLALVAGPGPLARIATQHLATGGKRTRARVACRVGAALGAPEADTLRWAAACELLHNATLIHDDLQDGDRVRRGRPATWVAHGPAQAINAGDLLLMLPVRALESMDAPPAVRWHLSSALSRRATACVRGQSLELSLPSMHAPGWSEWLSAARGKSGELLALPVEGAALLGGMPPSAAQTLGDVLVELGAVYQMVDDLVDLYGDKGRDALGCDLAEGKISCVVVEHLERVPADGAELRRLLALPRDVTPQHEIDAFRTAFVQSGAAAAVAARIHASSERLLCDPTLVLNGPVHALAAQFLAAFTHPLSKMELTCTQS